MFIIPYYPGKYCYFLAIYGQGGGGYLATSWRQFGAGRFIYKRATADSSSPVLSWLPWRQHPSSDARSFEVLMPPYTITISKPEAHIQRCTWLNPDCTWHHSRLTRYASQPLGLGQLTSPVSWGNSPHETVLQWYMYCIGVLWVSHGLG